MKGKQSIHGYWLVWLVITREGEETRMSGSTCTSLKDKLKLSSIWVYEGSPSVQNESSEHKAACHNETNVTKITEIECADMKVNITVTYWIFTWMFMCLWQKIEKYPIATKIIGYKKN